jgi:hypothetical protein
MGDKSPKAKQRQKQQESTHKQNGRRRPSLAATAATSFKKGKAVSPARLTRVRPRSAGTCLW